MTQPALPWWDMRAYDYALPPDLIAQEPAAQRDASRLLVYDMDRATIVHHVFTDLPALLRPDDVLVVNDCRVLPARLFGTRAGSGGAVEVLLTERVESTVWRAMVRPGRACKLGATLVFAGIRAHVRAALPDGQRELAFACTPAEFDALLERAGVVPLPPYIKRPRAPSSAADRERYQTVYARAGCAIAAPTAGLHFTNALLETLRARGCSILSVTLDVGIGTFQPVAVDDLRQHRMHAEHCRIDAATATALNAARAAGRRIIAVGTTALRTLETCLDAHGHFQPFDGPTDIFIHPPMRIRAIDGLLTNFHLPRSTLLVLLAAWLGPDVWRALYDEAIHRRYRFYSYGDAMLATRSNCSVF
jgi:S-adenosylmethionine:tRNA ribosyltransferase-isomerase